VATTFTTRSEEEPQGLILSDRASFRQKMTERMGRSALFSIAALAALAVLFIFFYIARDAMPFFQLRGFREFFVTREWYPSREPAYFGALSIFFGSALVTLGAALVAVPLGIAAAICLSDVLPFGVRQVAKPVIEILAAIPSVAYGFFALVVLAPLLQRSGHTVLSAGWWLLATPALVLLAVILGDALTVAVKNPVTARRTQIALTLLLGAAALWALWAGHQAIQSLTIVTGANALNVAVILGIMALPTVVSVSEDSLQAVGRELREGSYALGATRAEMLCKTVLPAASSGLFAASMLGIMRALGETMVVWMASGNAAQIPSPWYNFLMPVRTLTATIAGEMGEADHVTGSARYHVLFAMGLCLLLFCFACNLAAEWVVARQRRRLRGE
jgi:phosphate transport system permease protein